MKFEQRESSVTFSYWFAVLQRCSALSDVKVSTDNSAHMSHHFSLQVVDSSEKVDSSEEARCVVLKARSAIAVLYVSTLIARSAVALLCEA